MKPSTKDQVEGEFHEAKGRAVVVMVVGLLVTVIFATANLAVAAPGKAKSSAIAATTAQEHVESRIKQLRSAIKVTEAQELSWNNLTKVMRENAKEMDTLTKERGANPKVMNAVEELKFHLTITQTQVAQLEEFIPLFEALYTSMSDEQKISADAMFQKGRHPGQKKK